MDTDAMTQSIREAMNARFGTLPEGFAIDVSMAMESQGTYTGLTHERSLFTPGFLMDPADSLVQAAALAVGRPSGQGPAHVRPWTFATDGGWTQGVFGIPTIGFAPGEERYAHTNRERLELDEARWSFERYPDLVLGLQQVLA
jgi:acetylornithine deacetylase/succinyl-diaminopimelate desuccinylase-like protein